MEPAGFPAMPARFPLPLTPTRTRAPFLHFLFCCVCMCCRVFVHIELLLCVRVLLRFVLSVYSRSIRGVFASCFVLALCGVSEC